MTKKTIAQDVVERARAQFPKSVESARAYIGPLIPQRRPTDHQLTHMAPDALAGLSQTDPLAAEQAARRLQVLEAKAAALPNYPDDYEPS